MLLTGYGPTARQRRLVRRRMTIIRGETSVIGRGTAGTGRTLSAEQRVEQMEARRRAIDDLLRQDDKM